MSKSVAITWCSGSNRPVRLVCWLAQYLFVRTGLCGLSQYTSRFGSCCFVFLKLIKWHIESCVSFIQALRWTSLFLSHLSDLNNKSGLYRVSHGNGVSKILQTDNSTDRSSYVYLQLYSKFLNDNRLNRKSMPLNNKKIQCVNFPAIINAKLMIFPLVKTLSYWDKISHDQYR